MADHACAHLNRASFFRVSFLFLFVFPSRVFLPRERTCVCGRVFALRRSVAPFSMHLARTPCTCYSACTRYDLLQKSRSFLPLSPSYPSQRTVYTRVYIRNGTIVRFDRNSERDSRCFERMRERACDEMSFLSRLFDSVVRRFRLLFRAFHCTRVLQG